MSFAGSGQYPAGWQPGMRAMTGTAPMVGDPMEPQVQTPLESPILHKDEKEAILPIPPDAAAAIKARWGHDFQVDIAKQKAKTLPESLRELVKTYYGENLEAKDMLMLMERIRSWLEWRKVRVTGDG